MFSWIGGTQSTFNRGFFRAAIMRLHFPEDRIVFQTHDLDTIGQDPRQQEKVMIKPATEKNGLWLPLYWERPFSSVGNQRFCFCFSEKKPYILSALRFSWPGLAEKFLEQLRIESAWALEFVVEEEKPMAKERAWLLEQKAIVETDPDKGNSVSEVQQELALFILKNRLDSVEFNTSREFWKLTPVTAQSEAFALLDRFLSLGNGQEAYAQLLKSAGRKTPPKGEIPFYAVIPNEDGLDIRVPISLEGGLKIGEKKISSVSPQTTRELAEMLSQSFEWISVVPRALPLMVTLRMTYGYYSNKIPAYIYEAEKLARILKIEQKSLVIVSHNLIETLGKKKWRQMFQLAENLLSKKETYGFNSYYRGSNNVRSKLLTAWNKDITLLFAWVIGGEEFLDQLISQAKVKQFIRR